MTMRRMPVLAQSQTAPAGTPGFGSDPGFAGSSIDQISEIDVSAAAINDEYQFLPVSLQAQPGYNVNLLQHEFLGGHTIALHVAKSLSFLRNRFTNGSIPNARYGVSQASAFNSLRQATALINMALNQNQAGIDAMMATPGDAWAVISATFDNPTGYSVTYGVGGSEDVYSLYIYLQKPAATPEGFLIKTAYPGP